MASRDSDGQLWYSNRRDRERMVEDLERTGEDGKVSKSIYRPAEGVSLP